MASEGIQEIDSTEDSTRMRPGYEGQGRPSMVRLWVQRRLTSVLGLPDAVRALLFDPETVRVLRMILDGV